MLGSLTVGFGLAAPFMIYGAALLVAATVVFVSLRHSAVAAPEVNTEPAVSVRTVLRHRAYRAALFSNFATGWAAFGLRIALVPLFVVEGLGYGAGFAGMALATFAIGNISVVIPSGYLSDRIGRRKLLIVGLTVSAASTVLVGFTSSLPVFLAGGVRDRRGDGHLHLAAAGRGGRHRREQGARRDGGRDVSDDGRPGLDHRIARGRPDRRARARSAWAFVVSGAVLLLAAIGWMFAPETRGLPPVRADTDPRDRSGGRRRSAVTCDFEGLPQVV